MIEEDNQSQAQEGSKEAPPNALAGDCSTGRGVHHGSRGCNCGEGGQGRGNTNGRANTSAGTAFKGNTDNM